METRVFRSLQDQGGEEGKKDVDIYQALEFRMGIPFGQLLATLFILSKRA
jgi:hypothetical protein